MLLGHYRQLFLLYMIQYSCETTTVLGSLLVSLQYDCLVQREGRCLEGNRQRWTVALLQQGLESRLSWCL